MKKYNAHTDLNCLRYDYDSWRYPKNWFRNIQHFFRTLQYAYQRITKGYCERDVWNLDCYYSDLFYETLNYLADISQGYSGHGIFSDKVAEKEGYEDGYAKWQEYLREMAQHFYNCQEWHDDVPENAKVNQYWEEMDKYRSDMKFVPIKDSTLFKLDYDIYDEIKYQRAEKKWRYSEIKAAKFRYLEKDKAFEMMKEYFFNLWD